MRLAGDLMLVGIKDSAKLIGIVIVAYCAVVVCTLFMNYYMDMVSIEADILSQSPQMMAMYDAQKLTAKVVCAVSGGCLLLTSIVMLMFYIKHYIDSHKKDLGICKALGYSDLKIAKSFWVFGISIFIGTLLGFLSAFLIMPSFYHVQNADLILPDLPLNFHPILLICLVILPTIAFAILAIAYACHKLKTPVIRLLKDQLNQNDKVKKHKNKEHINRYFIDDLKKNTLRDKKVLVFFIIFASFCFSAMTQMSFSMKDLSSVMMGAMMMLIGLTLAFTILFLALTTVIHGNTKTIAMMRVFGYSQKECSKAILGGYRPMAYIGFVLGTIYQYVLLRIMVDVVFQGIGNIPTYEFDVPLMLVSLVAFIVVYEAIMYVYSRRIKNISVKEIMIE